MKTKLPIEIKTIAGAKKFLQQLYRNSETFHPEDDCHTIEWNSGQPTFEECELLNKLMEDIYNLPGNDGRHCDPMVFCPCGYLLELDSPYFIINRHGKISVLNGWNILEKSDNPELSTTHPETGQYLEDFIRQSSTDEIFANSEGVIYINIGSETNKQPTEKDQRVKFKECREKGDENVFMVIVEMRGARALVTHIGVSLPIGSQSTYLVTDLIVLK